MEMRIRLTWPAGQLAATLDEPPSPAALAAARPLVATARTWGEEVHVDTGLALAPENGARQVVDPGTAAFWTGGSAPALPYGPTPLSRGGESRLAPPAMCSAASTATRALDTVRGGDPLRVERA